MVKWLAAVASLAGAMLFLATPVAAQPVTGHASNDDFLGIVSIGSVAEGRIGDRGEISDLELSIGQQLPIRTDQFDWVSGETYDWTLSYEPGSFGGAVRFDVEGTEVFMATFSAFNSFFIRTNADRPNSSILVSNLILGPPPSAGGGGLTIFEASMPQTPANSMADGNGAALDVLKISNVDLVVGFTLQGQVTMFFDEADPQPTGSELAFRGYVVQAPDFPDGDGDGVQDDQDNCPNISNSGQTDSDFDDLGDVCDNCDSVANGLDEANIPGVGNQTDSDADGAGDACDNCNPGCNLIIPPTGSCANNQDDQDGDGIGDRCDNCRTVANPDQEDTNHDGLGNACLPTVVTLDVQPASSGVQSASSFSSVQSALGANAVAGPVTTINISLDCNLNVGSANIGILPTGGAAFVDFASCTDPHVLALGEPDDHRWDCTTSTELGGNVDPGSYTIGPGISATTNPQASAGLVFLQLAGKGGATNDLLCEAGQQNVFLGPLHIENFVAGDNPLTTQALGGFDPPRQLLEGPSGAPVIELAFVEIEILGAGDPLVTFELKRAPTDPDRRFELRMAAPLNEIDKLVVGLTADAAPTQADVKLSGCEVPGSAVGDVPSALQASLRGCPHPDDFPRGAVIGPTVLIPTAFDFFGVSTPTYTFGPGPADGTTRRANTLYVAIKSKTGTLNTSSSGDTTLLGVVEFAEPVDMPQIVLAGGETLPGFATGVIVEKLGTTIGNENVSIVTTFSSDDDLDGDGFGDEDDNCPSRWNGGANPQRDDGGVDTSAAGDGIGNVCQCFDFSGDGVVDDADTVVSNEDDVVPCQQVLAGLPADAEAAEKCATIGGKDFGIVDLIVGELESAGEDTGLADTAVGLSAKAGGIQVCAPAVELPQ